MKRTAWSGGLRSVLASAAAVLLAATTPALAVIVPVDLGLTPPDPMNQFDISVTAQAFGMPRSGSDTATVTGNVLAALGIEFDPVTHEVTSVDELEFTGGTIYLSDVSLTLNYGLLGTILVSGTGVSGTLDTPDPPGTVTEGTFNTAEHLVILNNGQFHAYGTGAVGGLFEPITIDLSAEPVGATTDMTGYLDASLSTVVRETATYDVAMTLPVDFDEVVYDQDRVVVTVAVVGTVESTGEFSRTVPYFGAVSPDVSTRLEEADPGATSFTRGPGDSELEWTLYAPRVDGLAEVDDAFTDPLDPGNLHQFHVLNADTVVTSERIDVRDFAGLQVAVDVRSWDTSFGFEGEDDVDLSVLVSYDGLNFDEEIFWLEIEGDDITALDNGQNGAFTTFGSQVGLIPDDVMSMRVVVDVDTNSHNEHVMWDNVVVTGIPISEMSTLTWNGPGDGPWDSTTQWTGGQQGQSPDNTTHVVVPTNTVTVDAGGAAYTLSIHSGGAVVVDAEKTLAVGPSLEVADGMLDVQGTLNAWSVSVTAGMLSVGPTGTLSVGSEFTLGGGSEYACELDALDNGLIDAAGDVFLHDDTTLELLVLESLGAPGCYSRTVLSSAGEDGINGDFQTKPAEDDYLDYGVFLEGYHVPDPPNNYSFYTLDLFQAGPGDVDGDGDVDLDDLSLQDDNWDPTATDKIWIDGDVDGDGDVDLDDLSLLDDHWAPAGYPLVNCGLEGAGAPLGGPAPVPEPGTLVLLGMGLAGLWTVRTLRRRRAA